jgi:hypothetical protein
MGFAISRVVAVSFGLMVVAGAAARAEPRSVAVLDIDGAADLTAALRDRADASSTYELASRYGDLGELMRRDCAPQPATAPTPACLTAVARDLGVQVLLLGRVEPAAGHFAVHVQLFDAATNGFAKSVDDTVDASELDASGVGRLAPQLYAQLTGETAPTPKPVEPTSDTATVSGPAGLMAAPPATPASPASSISAARRPWRTMFVAAAAGTVVAVGMVAYGVSESSQLGGGLFNFGSKCMRFLDGGFLPSDPSGCKQGQLDADLSNAGLVGVMALGTLAVVGLYEGYMKRDAADERVVVAPVLGPSQAGAVVQIVW